MADDGGSTRTAVDLDDEGRQLAIVAAKAEYRQKIAEADQARSDLRIKRWTQALPSFISAPVQGVVEVGDGAGYLTEWVALDRLHQAARDIAGQVAHILTDRVHVLVVEDRDLVRSDWPHWQVTIQLRTAQDTLRRIDAQVQEQIARLAALPTLSPGGQGPPESGRHVQPPEGADTTVPDDEEPGEVGTTAPMPAPGGAATALVGSVADLVGLFRTDYTLTSRAVSVPAAALTVAVAAAVAKVRADAGSTVVLDGLAVLSASAVQASFTAMLSIRDSVAASQAGLAGVLGPLEAQVSAARAEMGRALERRAQAVSDDATANQIAELDRIARVVQDAVLAREKDIDHARSIGSVAETTVAAVDVLAQSLTTAPAGGYPPLVAAAIRERLHSPGFAGQSVQPAPAQITHVLYVSLNTSGGEVVTRKNLFGSSGRVGFLGGVHASWLLAEPSTGAILGGGSVNSAGMLLYDLGTNECWLNMVTPAAASGPSHPLAEAGVAPTSPAETGTGGVDDPPRPAPAQGRTTAPPQWGGWQKVALGLAIAVAVLVLVAPLAAALKALFL